VGLVELHLNRAKDLSKAKVAGLNLWCHRDESDLKRDETVENLTKMLGDLVDEAKKGGIRLAPVIGLGCPGIIREDGSIASGAHNLPGNWESSKFNLPRALRERIPTILDHDTVVVIHNDAVVQGLSEIPHMQDVKRWGILTIGTGLGNALFSNRALTKAKG
jgi:predicted NBD/HSP70 family sugar kinase